MAAKKKVSKGKKLPKVKTLSVQGHITAGGYGKF